MNSTKIVFAVVVLLNWLILNQSCGDQSERERQEEKSNQTELLEKQSVLKFAEDTAVKIYGNIIKTELPLRAKLVSDSVWIVEGTLPKNAKGGTVYMEILRENRKVLRITHYK